MGIEAKGRGKKAEFCDFSCKPCRGRFGFEFSPKEGLDLDLGGVCEMLQTEGMVIEAKSPYLATIKFRNAKITLFRSGKVLVKEAGGEARAREIAENLLRVISP